MGSLTKALELLEHPSEFKAAVQLKYYRKPTYPLVYTSDSEKECYALLKHTSRSFCAVIEELNPELRNAIMVFYLVLRALDTVEDDMSIDNKVKLPLLTDFYKKLSTKDWTFDGNSPTEKDRIVLTNFDQILTEYHKLKKEYQDVIQDITKQMGAGMAEYAKDEDFQLNGVRTVADYDKYCHYVAGLVGEGLTQLIVEAKFGDPSLKDRMELSESMGLFLQKTNIIRDYKEDLDDGRTFWPKEIWSKYADKLSDFEKPENYQAGVHCINDLVLDALGEAKDSITYLALIYDHSTFNFCAIPQVMAIATLAEVFQNEQVLKRNVKIRKGTTCQLILQSRTYEGVLAIFSKYLREIHHKLPVADPNYLELSLKLGEIEQFLEEVNPAPSHLPPGAKPMQSEAYLSAQKKIKTDAALQPVLDGEAGACDGAFIFFGATFFAVIYLIYNYQKSA